jgi:hypothetical protein
MEELTVKCSCTVISFDLHFGHLTIGLTLPIFGAVFIYSFKNTATNRAISAALGASNETFDLTPSKPQVGVVAKHTAGQRQVNVMLLHHQVQPWKALIVLLVKSHLSAPLVLCP